MSTTGSFTKTRPTRASGTRLLVRTALACAMVFASTGCSGSNTGSTSNGVETSAAVPADAGGVRITPEALANKPEPWRLDTPEAAVRSYLAWTSYAYRIGRSDVATPTMTPYEDVRVDAYIQYGIQEGRVIDQTLESIAFGTASAGTTSTLLPAKETWRYRYVSITTAGKAVGGPYSATYDTTYTVVESEAGLWQVDSVEAVALGEVK